jgi:hypothetical protein
VLDKVYVQESSMATVYKPNRLHQVVKDECGTDDNETDLKMEYRGGREDHGGITNRGDGSGSGEKSPLRQLKSGRLGRDQRQLALIPLAQSFIRNA